MITDLKVIIYEEKNILSKMLNLLDEQYKYILEKDIKKLNEIVKDLEDTSRELASLEIKRRSIVSEDMSMKSIVDESNDEHFQEAYKDIVSTIKMVELQKETNDILIKQELFFTKKMINFIKPNNKNANTYNAYGQIKK
jgi:flagellar biosynthesis/type III secretory pathway chaperone